MERARFFESVADTYDRARPGYPAALYSALVEETGLGPGTRVLEIGAGSGQATAVLAGYGAVIDAIEPGPRLADRLKRRLPDVQTFIADVEDVALRPAEYDLVVAATAMHYVDLPKVLPALHAAMAPGAKLAVWWTVFFDPDMRTPFRDRVSQILATSGSQVGLPGPLNQTERTAELLAGGWFTDPVVRTLRWSIDLGRDQIFDLFQTFPGWAAAPRRIAEVADAVTEVGRPGPLGPLVTEHYTTVLYVLTRADDPVAP